MMMDDVDNREKKLFGIEKIFFFSGGFLVRQDNFYSFCFGFVLMTHKRMNI